MYMAAAGRVRKPRKSKNWLNMKRVRVHQKERLPEGAVSRKAGRAILLQMAPAGPVSSAVKPAAMKAWMTRATR